TPDSEELPEPLEVIHVPAGQYIRFAVPPEFNIWEHLKEIGYIHEGDAMLSLTNMNDESDRITLLTVRKKGERSARKKGEQPAKPKEDINQHAGTQPQIVRDWIAKMDKFMREAGCTVQGKVVSNNARTDAKFVYTSKKTKKTVCNINIGTSGCNISLRGHHFMFPGGSGNILDEYPELAKRRPFACGCRKPDYSINPGSACVHGIAGTYTYNGELYAKCAYSGFDYALNEATNFDLLTRWIELESTFDGEVKPMQLKIGDIVEIERDEIDILDEYLNGQPRERCINALWSVYNVMKKMSADTTYKTTFGILYHLCKSAVFKNDNMDALICIDTFKPNKWLTGINYQYLPEKYGFAYSDMVGREGVTLKNKTDLRQIKQLTLSYNGNDFDDVLFGMKLFVEINEKQSWPYFYEADVRIANGGSPRFVCIAIPQHQ
ncbi:MAG: hypothetical protein FWG38_06860, partial [Defluviitaleaceae bacterium]|nr:hypothetical protein [Defluviitaleaceae bacterium]